MGGGSFKSHVTMMVGDGFNDSAALAVADIGVAVGAGESVNLDAADVMFPGDEPKMLVDLYDLSVKMNGALLEISSCLFRLLSY